MNKKQELLSTKIIKEEDEIPIKLKIKKHRSISPSTSNHPIQNRTNSNYRLLKKIKEELSKIEPESLILRVDPQVNSNQTIEQIQFYYYKIKKEMSIYYNQEQKKKMLKEKIDNLSKQIDIIVHPLKSKSIFRIDKELEIGQYEESKDEKKKENKPIIDYRVKIRSLEKELEYTYQGYNSIKSKNNNLIDQLDEMRKQNIFHMNKLNGLKNLLKEKDEKFKEDKDKVKENLKNKDENQYLNKLIEKQNLLIKINKDMTENIKDTNIENMQKKAKQKYLDFHQKKLANQSKFIEERQLKKIEKFNEEIKDELDKIKEFNEESEILKILNIKKMKKLEMLLNEIFEETKIENAKQLIEYLTKSCEENIKFQNSVQILQKELDKLEKEVSELEYILYFCEDNNSVKKKSKFGEKELKVLEKISFTREIFNNLQYEIINKLFNDYNKSFFELMKQCGEMTEEHIFKIDNINGIITFLHKIEERLRNFYEKLKNNNNVGSFDFNKWNHKWDKIYKVKEGILNNYIKKFGEGLKFDTNNIKSLVDEYIIKEKINKERKLIELGNK